MVGDEAVEHVAEQGEAGGVGGALIDIEDHLHLLGAFPKMGFSAVRVFAVKSFDAVGEIEGVVVRFENSVRVRK